VKKEMWKKMLGDSHFWAPVVVLALGVLILIKVSGG